LRHFLSAGYKRDRGGAVGFFAEERLELAGQAATAAAKLQRERAGDRQAAP